ncbi:hypothetical protein D3C75_828950 [compost metagenome]
MQQEQRQNGGQHGGQGNVDGLLPAVGPVHYSCLIQVRVNAGNRRQVDNRPPPDFLPDAGKHYDRTEKTLLLHKQNRLHAHPAPEHVEHAFVGEQLEHDSADHYPGQEVGQVKQALHHPLGQHVPHFIEEHGQDNRCGEAKQQFVESDYSSVSQNIVKILIREDKPEIIEADPRAPVNSFEDLIVLEGDHASPQGHIFEDDKIQHAGQRHQIEHPMLPHIRKIAVLTGFGFDGG